MEIVRRAFEEFQTDGWEGRFITFFAPEIIWDMTPSGVPGLGTYRGHAGLRAFFEDDWFAAFPLEEWEQELVDIIDCGEKVVLIAHQRGHGSSSGASVELEYIQLCTLRDGKMVRVDTYLDRGKALEAAGLSE